MASAEKMANTDNRNDCLVSIQVSNIDWRMIRVPRHKMWTNSADEYFFWTGKEETSVPKMRTPLEICHGVEFVPEIRVWGSTSVGQRACIHIHGAFPYFFIRPSDPFVAEAFNRPGFLDVYSRSYCMPSTSSAVLAEFQEVSEGVELGPMHTDDIMEELHIKFLPHLRRQMESGIHRTKRKHKSSSTNGGSSKKSDNIDGASKCKDTTGPPAVRTLQVVRLTPMYGYHSSPVPFVKVELYNPYDLRHAVEVCEQLGMQSYESHLPFLLNSS